MPTLHQAPATPIASDGTFCGGFQRIVLSLLRPPHQVRSAHAECTGGHAERPHKAGGKANQSAGSGGCWPAGCELSLSEQALDRWYGKEPMSWEV